MSRILIHDLAERARARIGRTYQVAALAPYPARPAQHLWAFTRRNFVHGAADIDTAFGFGGDSNLLRRLKMGLLEGGADQATIDSLTERDVTTDARGVTVRASALARLPATARQILEAPTRAPKPQNWFFEKRPAQKIARAQAGALLDDYEDAGDGGTQQLTLQRNESIGASRNQTYVAGPLILTHIAVAGFLASSNASFGWSVSPPGVGESGSSPAATATTASAFLQSGFGDFHCHVPVLQGGVTLELFLSNNDALQAQQLALSIAFTRLRRKPLT